MLEQNIKMTDSEGREHSFACEAVGEGEVQLTSQGAIRNAIRATDGRGSSDEEALEVAKAKMRLHLGTAKVEVYLDDNVPEYMDGIVRVGSARIVDHDGEELYDDQTLVDNTEYHSEDELRADLAKRLNVSVDDVEVIE